MSQAALDQLTLEDLVAGQGFADLPASPLQRAICKAAQGRPLDGAIDEEACSRHFGVRSLPAIAPALVVVVCGIRRRPERGSIRR